MLDRRTLLAAAASATLPLLARAQGKPGRNRIVLGQSVPLTGAADQIGLAFAGGSKLFFDAANARPAAPWSFELVQVDDGYDPAKAAANAKKLLAGGADLLFGFVGTGSGDAAAAVARQEGALLFAPLAASDALRDPSVTQVFHVRPSLADEAFKMVRHCATLGQNRLAVVGEDDAMGRAGLAAVNQAIADLKMPPLVASAFVPVNSDKVDAAVAALANAQPQAILQVSLFNTTAAFIRRMRKTGYAGAFMNFSVVGIDPLFAALGKEIGGVVVSQVVPSPRSTTVPIVKEYLQALDNSDQTPSYESLEGYIAAKTLAEAVRRSGRVDRAALQKTMAAMTDYDVGGFRINLRAGVRDSVRTVDLVSITADGRIVR
ncbi:MULTISPECIES: ABC transporter substrate-binding protein [Ramlibacter]|uniref:ABC transporter substrate-binding protein n=1 Tax=Ramlibacter pinisoli TaxID=2682844 RepID=A0A6N8INW4_9BURK|nr:MULTISPECIES: ABC transporter substrate-binding protein [Ramlibacter]MBA2963497.1 ABC transporter substrate-binding protein [Ramlibacter sp. CGMCC 1.13660]MVQ28464.1 ABC transporter substrate-binding protein [Ramlibacter pinisoli]